MQIHCRRCGSEMAEIRPGHWRCETCAETPLQEQVIQRLRQHRSNIARLRICQQKLEAMTEVAASRIGAGGGSGPSDPTGGRATTAADLQREIAQLQLAVTEVEAALESLDQVSEQLLWMHCVDRRSASSVMDALHLSRTTFYRMRADALETVGRLIGTKTGHFRDTFGSTG